MTKDEELDLALKVMQINLTLLEKINPYKGQEDLLSDSLDLTHKAITAIKQARSAPVQPVISAGPITPAMQAGPTTEQKEQMVRSMQSAYPAAQSAPTLQEPVAWMYEVNGAHTILDLFEPKNP